MYVHQLTYFVTVEKQIFQGWHLFWLVNTYVETTIKYFNTGCKEKIMLK